MSYSIIQTGGKQYKVKAGEILKVERLEDSKLETKIEFKEILAYGDDKTIEVGSPVVEGAKVEADLVENGKNRTILIFKKRRRQNSRRKNGHRQQYSLIRISKIFSKDGKVLSEASKLVKPTKKIQKIEAIKKDESNELIKTTKKIEKVKAVVKAGSKKNITTKKIKKVKAVVKAKKTSK
jgi:large subunit ribosomal protein L21